MSPEEVATRVIYQLFAQDHHYPQDWNTDDTKTIGQWKAAIVEAVKEFQQSHQKELDDLENRWMEAWRRRDENDFDTAVEARLRS